MFAATRCRINYEGHATKPVLPIPCIWTATDESSPIRTKHKKNHCTQSMMPSAIKPLIIFSPIVPFNHKAERTERNHVCSHSLQNQLPRTRHEASAAIPCIWTAADESSPIRTTHIRNHCTQSMPSAIKPLHHLPSHSSIQPQGRKDREEPCLQATRCRINYQEHATKPVLPTPCIWTAADESSYAQHT